jgi:cobalt-zinc-cadmium efflux system outer membrane protein
MNGAMGLMSFVLALGLAAPVDRPGHLEATAPPRAVGFDEAIDLVDGRPSVAVRDDAAAARRGLDRRLTGTVSQPQILVQPGLRVLPTDRQTFAMQATVLQSWNVTGLGRARRAAARQETRAFDAHTRAQRLEQRLAAARAWIDLHAVERQLELARHDAATSRTMVAAVQRAVDAGVLVKSDLAQARAHGSVADARVIALEGQAHDLGLVLARETASDPWTPLATLGPAPAPVLPDEAELATRLAAVERLPPVRARALTIAAARARAVEQARQARGTQLTAGAQVDRDDPDGLLAYGILGVSFAGRGAGGRAKADAVLEQAQLHAADLEDTATLTASVATALHELHHTRAVLEHLDAELVPALGASLDALLRQREAGEATVFEVLAARRALAAAQMDRVAAESALNWAQVHAWLLLAAVTEEPTT